MEHNLLTSFVQVTKADNCLPGKAPGTVCNCYNGVCYFCLSSKVSVPNDRESGKPMSFYSGMVLSLTDSKLECGSINADLTF